MIFKNRLGRLTSDDGCVKNSRWRAVCLAALFSTPVLSWNAEGHRVIAQIAVNHLTPQAYVRFNAYNHVLDKPGHPETLVTASVWLDTYNRHASRNWDPMHYVDKPYTEDGSPLPPLKPINAVFAVTQAHETLLNPDATLYARAIAVRILLHVVGDLHQPLHAITRVSYTHPKGDRGGNLVRMPPNRVADNLHAYWDRGAGLLTRRTKLQNTANKAANLEMRFPCASEKMDINPAHWAEESYELAVKQAYRVPLTEEISPAYQRMVIATTEARLAQAGCRLAAILNHIDNKRGTPLL